MEPPSVGIDLGTTNSCVAIYKNGKVEIIPNEFKSYVTPSWVTFTTDGIFVGQEAKSKSHLYVKNSVYEFKRLIGEKFDSEKIKQAIKSVPYSIVNADGIPKIKVNYKGQDEEYSPEKLSSYILAKLKDMTEKHIEKTVNRVVVTVPAYFNDFQRQATKNAAVMAGFQTVNIINEPTAAALAFSHIDVKPYNRNVLVYDFGGGTFDVSVVTIGRGQCIVKGTKGKSHLGGTDIDLNLLEHIRKDFKNQHGTEMGETEVDIRRLKNKCESVKKSLSGTIDTAEIDMNLLSGKDYFTIITKAEFERLNHNIFEETLEITKTCLEESGLTINEIDKVLLVGGSSRNHKVHDMLEEYFGVDKISQGINPDEAVAYGAAIHAHHLLGDKLEVKDVISLSLGIELLDKSFATIIAKNTPIPVTKTRNFCTGSASTSINVYQGEAVKAADNFKLGSFVLDNVNYSKIDVTFEIDSEGILKVTAVSKINENNTNHIVINMSTNGLTSKQIEEGTDDIIQHRQNEISRHRFYESKWELEMLCELAAENGKKTNDVEILKLCTDVSTWLKDITVGDKGEVDLKKQTLENYIYGSSK